MLCLENSHEYIVLPVRSQRCGAGWHPARRLAIAALRVPTQAPEGRLPIGVFQTLASRGRVPPAGTLLARLPHFHHLGWPAAGHDCLACPQAFNSILAG